MDHRTSLSRARATLARALLAAIVLSAIVGAGVGAAQPRAVRHPHRVIPGRLVAYRAGVADGRVTRVDARMNRTAPATALSDWNIIYKGDGWTRAARTVLRNAIAYWAAQVASDVPITVKVVLRDLPGNVLGSAGPTAMVENWTTGTLPVVDTFYPVALANALSGVDQNGAEPEIVAQFDSRMPWYMGTDNVVPADRVSFRGTVLHELAHGLGMIGSAWVSDGVATIGDPGSTGNDHPWIYDRFVEAGSQPGSAILDMGPGPLRSALLGRDLWFEGAATTAPRARLHAPSRWDPGSSYSHLDEAAYPRGSLNSLMTPIGDYGEGNATAGPLVLRMLQDMGWNQAPTTACTRPADLDGDGFNDVVGIATDGDLVIAPGTDTGTLLPRRVIGHGFGHIAHLVVEDWTGDGCADLLAYAPATRELVLLPVTGDAQIGAPVTLVDFDAGGTWNVTGLAAVHDLDGDGLPDILVRANQVAPTPQAGQLWRIRGDGSGGVLSGPGGIADLGTGWRRPTEFFSAGDWDGDGRGDLFVRDRGHGGTLRLHPGRRDGTLGRARPMGRGWNAYDELFGSPDLTGDGLPEIVGRTASKGRLVIRRATRHGGLLSGAPVISSSWSRFPVID